jgi:hypothetical protein
MPALRHGNVIGIGLCVRVRGEGGYFVYSTRIKDLTWEEHVVDFGNRDLVFEDGVVDKTHVIGVGEGARLLGVADVGELVGEEVDKCRGGGPPSNDFTC